MDASRRQELFVSSICTWSRIREFLIAKYSLEQYHTCRWIVATDARSREYLERRWPEEQWLELCAEEGKHHAGEYEAFLRVVMNKMEVMRRCIAEHGDTLYIDSDLIFIGPFELDGLVPYQVVYSSHYIDRREITDKFGLFNVGMIFCRSRALVDRWEALTRARFDQHGLEQKPFEVAVLESSLPRREFGRGYNIGWWRPRNDGGFWDTVTLEEGCILIAGERVQSFHVHLDWSVGRPFEYDFRNRVKDMLLATGDPKHRELHQTIASVLNGTL